MGRIQMLIINGTKSIPMEKGLFRKPFLKSSQNAI